MASGREYFAAYGCAACHSLGSSPALTSVAGKGKPMMELDPDHADGCLSAAPAAAPLFSLTNGQRDALRSALRDRESLRQAPGAPERSEKLMVLFSCYACHSRGGAGGPDPLRAQYFHVVGQVDLGDEGRIPPHLTRAGYKLRSSWLADGLVA